MSCDLYNITMTKSQRITSMTIKRKSLFTDLIDSKKIIWFIILMLFIERVIVIFFILGPEYNISNDDMGYINSGITFAEKGIVTIYSDEPTAMIMPATTVLLGLFSKIFGSGYAYFVSIKLLWSAIGCLTPFAVYRSIKLLSGHRSGLIMALMFFLPNFVWMDNVILTETPSFCIISFLIYLTIIIAKSEKKRFRGAYILLFITGLFFRSSTAVILLFTVLYLLMNGMTFIRVIKNTLILTVSVVIAIIPWTIRNYHYFGDLIPFTYGAGNTILEGTFQGYGYPEDSELDYDKNVVPEYTEKYSSYLNAEGEPKDEIFSQYLESKLAKMKAEYKLSEWIKTDPVSLFVTYLVIKPLRLPFGVFYWDKLFGVSYHAMIVLRCIEAAFCLFSLAFSIKRRRAGSTLPLFIAYAAILFLTSLTLALDRYAEPFIGMRYIIDGIGIGLILEDRKNKKVPVARSSQDRKEDSHQ